MVLRLGGGGSMGDKYGKLVRDKIPSVIARNGELAVVSTLSDAEYKKCLEDKLYEECQEAIEATGEARIEELADVVEVVDALAKIEQKNLDDVLAVAEVKRHKRGSFDKRIFLETVIKK